MLREKIYKWIFNIVAYTSLLFLLAIAVVIFLESIPLFKEVRLEKFLFGVQWYPTYDPPEFGILPLVVGTIIVTAGAMIFSVPIGVGSALYINELASEKQKSILKPTIEILAAIPSIVYGFFGMVVVAPFIQKVFDLPIGLNAFTASLILGLMSTPTVCSISEDALSYVPRSFKEASFALGANRWQTLTKVTVPAAGSGISTAIILGISRAIGETMTVLMVAGNAAIIPTSIFDPVRPMTSTIAAEMGEAVMGSLHYNALFSIGLLLFVITFIFNIIAEIISRRFRLKLGLGR
ncbi:MAG: phosphate ABC transporter permease subunit PstC [Bacteroidales bacterium]